ncbi:MAG: GFA family protein [Inquilinus sp.]|nr:GFA family protein [Inquilinus sp.]
MPSTRSGGCLCGKVRYEASDAPVLSIQCYCRDCQHISGGGHAPQFAVKRDTVSRSGPLKTFHLKSDAGNDLEFGFCGECGSPIYKTTTLAPELVFFFAGSLDDPATFTLETKVYEDRRQPWDES